MASNTVTDTSIIVHGRSSLVLPFASKDKFGATIDISSWVLRFEVDGIPISELLVADPNNSTGKLLKLERTQIATLKTSACNFALIDETDSANDIYNVVWSGTIKLSSDSFVGAPDTIG